MHLVPCSFSRHSTALTGLVGCHSCSRLRNAVQPSHSVFRPGMAMLPVAESKKSDKSALTDTQRKEQIETEKRAKEAEKELWRRAAEYPFTTEWDAEDADATGVMPAAAPHPSSPPAPPRRRSSAPAAPIAEDKEGSTHSAAHTKATIKSAYVQTLLTRVCARNLLFLGLTDAKRNAVVALMRPYDARSGEVIIGKGETGDEFFAVESGNFHVSSSSETASSRPTNPLAWHRWVSVHATAPDCIMISLRRELPPSTGVHSDRYC